MGVWRYLPLTVIRLVAAFTKDECRHKRCMEVLRVARAGCIAYPEQHCHPERSLCASSRYTIVLQLLVALVLVSFLLGANAPPVPWSSSSRRRPPSG